MSIQNLITLQEAASLLSVSSATLRNWDKTGRLKALRHAVNKYRMYRLEDVLAVQGNLSLFERDNQGSITTGEVSKRPLNGVEMRRLVHALHRSLRDTDGSSSLIERFDELTKVLYCKTHDERLTAVGGYRSVFQSNAENDAIAADRVRCLFAGLVRERSELFPMRFREISLSNVALARLTRQLATVSLGGNAEHVKGLAYEELIKNTFDKGDNQQFFTPPSVVEFIVSLTSEWLSGSVCDPACGTGGFLLRAALSKVPKVSSANLTLVGFELDERLAWAARMNLDMHEVPRFRVEHLPGAGTLGKELSRSFESVDVILTNPPFGSDLSRSEDLELFSLGRGRASRRRGVLFLERCLDLVRVGGIVGIVIDDGVLNSPSNVDVREHILRRAHPLAIISLPDTAFMPYATVKSSILILQKGDLNTSRVRTFFGEAEEVGRKSNGDPLLKMNPVTRQLELDSDLPTILSLWESGPTAAAVHQGRVRAFWSEIPCAGDGEFARNGLRLDLAYHHPARSDAVMALSKARYPLLPVHALCDLRNDAVVPSRALQDEQITYVGLANIESHTGEFTPGLVDGSSLKSAVKRFQAGDILFAKMRPELRKVCLIPEDIEEGFTSAECAVLVPKSNEEGLPIILPELLTILLRSDLAYGQLMHLVVGIGRPRLNQGALLNIRLPLPPTEEQRRLLEVFMRAESAAAALLEQSERARNEAASVLERAHAMLNQHVLR